LLYLKSTISLLIKLNRFIIHLVKKKNFGGNYKNEKN
jgi:hypothetical protein